MASHHHHHGPSSCGSCCCTCSPCSSDPLLRALATQLLRSQTQQHHVYLTSQEQPLLFHNPNPSPPPQPPPHLHHNQHHNPRHQTLVQSLMRRVAALESSLPDHIPSSPPPAPRVALRDKAARVIQTRFRLFLVRRSRTLRALRRLASIRSPLAALRSSLDRRLLDPKSLCQQASDLLLQLDSIQSGDPMVCEGKRSIGGEIAGIVELLERIPVQRQQIQILRSKPFGSVVSEEQVEQVECDGSSRVSSEDEEGEVLEGANVYGKGVKGNARLGLYAPLPVKMEPRRSELGGVLDIA